MCQPSSKKNNKKLDAQMYFWTREACSLASLYLKN